MTTEELNEMAKKITEVTALSHEAKINKIVAILIQMDRDVWLEGFDRSQEVRDTMSAVFEPRGSAEYQKFVKTFLEGEENRS